MAIQSRGQNPENSTAPVVLECAEAETIVRALNAMKFVADHSASQYQILRQYTEIVELYKDRINELSR
jgi:hypothetical protein